MSDANTYDARVRAIRAYNQPILDDFRAWLEQAGLSETRPIQAVLLVNVENARAILT